MQIFKYLFIALCLLTFKGFGQAPVDINFYLNSRQVSKVSKDFYYGKFKASDDDKTLSIIDSLHTRNNTTRPFYLYLVSKMMYKSDGALSEALGSASKEFMENHPDKALDFLYSSNKIVFKNFISNWSKKIVREFMINCEGREKACVKNSLQQTLLKTKERNKINLIHFYNQTEKAVSHILR